MQSCFPGLPESPFVQERAQHSGLAAGARPVWILGLMARAMASANIAMPEGEAERKCIYPIPHSYCAGKEIEKAGRTMFFRGKILLNKKRFRILPKPLFCRIALIAKRLSFAIFLSLALEKKIRLEKKPRQGGAVFPGL